MHWPSTSQEAEAKKSLSCSQFGEWFLSHGNWPQSDPHAAHWDCFKCTVLAATLLAGIHRVQGDRHQAKQAVEMTVQRPRLPVTAMQGQLRVESRAGRIVPRTSQGDWRLSGLRAFPFPSGGAVTVVILCLHALLQVCTGSQLTHLQSETNHA